MDRKLSRRQSTSKKDRIRQVGDRVLYSGKAFSFPRRRELTSKLFRIAVICIRLRFCGTHKFQGAEFTLFRHSELKLFRSDRAHMKSREMLLYSSFRRTFSNTTEYSFVLVLFESSSRFGCIAMEVRYVDRRCGSTDFLVGGLHTVGLQIGTSDRFASWYC